MYKTTCSKLTLLLITIAAVLLLGVAPELAAQKRPQGSSGPTPTNVTTDAPKITFPESSFDFGTVPRGSVNEHVFKIRNTGTAPLTLIKAQAG